MNNQVPSHKWVATFCNCILFAIGALILALLWLLYFIKYILNEIYIKYIKSVASHFIICIFACS